ncbi:MAG: bifunctional 4-hydroxy-2-oxoglutarate aldolase/2-dehydro-3-deoxy-phosphogluconate aldolase [Propionibacteriaceae bacterium]|nr:bifunctional 4-hydroxy-2-oxoglutarate aldolase/2-dehydro-3-deoxy-phosphogluconate aldolase [Propionibacteriaceae bacterium]
MLDVSLLKATKIVPVVVLDDAADAIPLARALVAGGLKLIEVTFRTSAATESIARISTEVPEAIAGAGTVINAEQVASAKAAGAKFLVSPGLLPEVITAANAAGLPIFPGVVTGSEIMQALALGVKVVKFFPAEVAGGVKMIKALAGPFPQLRFIPTGGVNETNLADYLSVSAVIAVGGTWMVDKKLIADKAWDRITELTRQAVASAKASVNPK